MKHREAERARRAAIRSLQEEMSLYFLVPGGRKISVGELLLFGKFATLGIQFKSSLTIFFSRRLPKDRSTCLPRAREEFCGRQLDVVSRLRGCEEGGS